MWVYAPLGENCHDDYGGYIHEVNYYIYFLNCLWFLTVTEQISFSDAGRTYSSVLYINSLTHISPILPHFQRLWCFQALNGRTRVSPGAEQSNQNVWAGAGGSWPLGAKSWWTSLSNPDHPVTLSPLCDLRRNSPAKYVVSIISCSIVRKPYTCSNKVQFEHNFCTRN